MIYDVIITSRADHEAQSIFNWWATNRSPDQAARWYDEFLKSASSLERNPDRCAAAVENSRFPYDLRQLNFGLGGKRTHRVVFTIRRNEVVILRVRHLSQDDVTLD